MNTRHLLLRSVTLGALLCASSVGIMARVQAADALPSLSVKAPEGAAEGNDAYKLRPFTVSLSAASTQQITVRVVSVNGTATAGSAPPADYQGVEMPLTFAPGDISKTVNVAVYGDKTVEDSETFSLTLNSPVNATLGTSSAATTIINDDSPNPTPSPSPTATATPTPTSEPTPVPTPALPTVSVKAPESAKEGNDAYNLRHFTVSLSAASTQQITVRAVTKNGTATGGTASPADYQPVEMPLTFASGEISKTVDVAVFGDKTIEDNETFSLTLNSPVNATLGTSSATTTIINDDTASPTPTPTSTPTPTPTPTLPTLSITAPEAAKEGDDGYTLRRFTVKLSATSTQQITVRAVTKNGTASEGSAPPYDYQQIETTLTFAPGETSKFIDVGVFGDTTVEADETFNVTLASPVNATIAVASATTTILNDDTKGYILTGKAVQYVPTSTGGIETVGIGGVTIACIGDDAASTKTDDKGAFTLRDVASGEYLVLAYKGSLPFDPAIRDVTVNDGNVSNLIFQTHTIYGQVYRREGDTRIPLPNVAIYINGVLKAKTDSNGRYALINLAAGDYTVQAKANGLTFPEAKPLSLGGTVKYAKVDILGQKTAPTTAKSPSAPSS